MIRKQLMKRFALKPNRKPDIQKDCDFSTPVSCFAGLGTRILGSLLEFVYSVDPGGIFLDLYCDSSITWQHRGEEGQLTTHATCQLAER